jgi:hypothetical protein
MLIFSVHLSQSYFTAVPESPLRISVSLFAIIFSLIYCSYKTFHLKNQIRNLQSGYEAEQAVGQELNQLMKQKAEVFHDVPAEGFNIDHVVITTNGIYAVETKSRMKPMKNRGKLDAKVIYDGNTLKFPDWVEAKPIQQAKSQAQWLSRELSKAVGEKILVSPVLVLPGWFIERIARNDLLVVNENQLNFLANKTQNSELSTNTFKLIVDILNQRCRNIEPTAYGKKMDRISK